MFIRQKSAFSTNRISKYYFKQILYYDSKRRKEWKKSERKQKKKEKAYQKGKNNRCWQEGFFFSPPSDTAKNAITCFFSVKRFWYKVSRSYMSYDKLRFLFFGRQISGRVFIWSTSSTLARVNNMSRTYRWHPLQFLLIHHRQPQLQFSPPLHSAKGKNISRICRQEYKCWESKFTSKISSM